MAHTNCCCSFMEQMITEMQSMRKRSPGEDTNWGDLFFPASRAPDDRSLCCLLTYLFYYGYCKECSAPLSEEARSVLSPLMEKEKAN